MSGVVPPHPPHMQSWPALGQLHLYLYPTVFGPEYVQFVLYRQYVWEGRVILYNEVPRTGACRSLYRGLIVAVLPISQ